MHYHQLLCPSFISSHFTPHRNSEDPCRFRYGRTFSSSSPLSRDKIEAKARLLPCTQRCYDRLDPPRHLPPRTIVGWEAYCCYSSRIHPQIVFPTNTSLHHSCHHGKHGAKESLLRHRKRSSIRQMALIGTSQHPQLNKCKRFAKEASPDRQLPVTLLGCLDKAA